jgi:hypothetical protein
MGKHTKIELDEQERRELEQLIRSGESAARQQTRARILLLSDRSQGQKRPDQEVADAVLCHVSTVGNIRRRYLEGGLPLALTDKGWPGAQPKLTGEVEANLTLLACSRPPTGHPARDRATRHSMVLQYPISPNYWGHFILSRSFQRNLVGNGLSQLVFLHHRFSSR